MPARHEPPFPGLPRVPPPPQRPQLIAGLGNPGPEYRSTRHNIGQIVVEHLAHRLHGRFRVRGPAVVAEVTWEGAPLYLAKPIAFMNVVGPSIVRLLQGLALDASALTLVYDDLDLAFGKVRGRHRGRHGGHNGVRSVIAALGTDEVRRVKVGIGRPTAREDVVDWVLTNFTAEERAALPAIVERAAGAALELAVTAANR